MRNRPSFGNYTTKPQAEQQISVYAGTQRVHQMLYRAFDRRSSMERIAECFIDMLTEFSSCREHTMEEWDDFLSRIQSGIEELAEQDNLHMTRGWGR